jgi:hypothetical protein
MKSGFDTYTDDNSMVKNINITKHKAEILLEASK